MNISKKSINVLLNKELAERIQFLRKFKNRVPDLNIMLEVALIEIVEKAERRAKIGKDDWLNAKTCPVCSTGVLSKKIAIKTKSAFYGCNRYPDCRHTETFTEKRGINVK